MSAMENVLEAGNLLSKLLIDPDVPPEAKQRIHDVMNSLTRVVFDLDEVVYKAPVMR